MLLCAAHWAALKHWEPLPLQGCFTCCPNPALFLDTEHSAGVLGACNKHAQILCSRSRQATIFKGMCLLWGCLCLSLWQHISSYLSDAHIPRQVM